MLTINITLDPRDKSDTLDLHLEAIGFKRAAIAPSIAKTMLAEASPISKIHTFTDHARVGGDNTVEVTLEGGAITSIAVQSPSASEPPFAHQGEALVRVPGQPSPGHKRRTKAEIAEDEAYFAAQKPSDETTATAASGDEPESVFASDAATTAAHVAAVAGVNPADATQDAADEAAETAKTKGDKLTLDDLRKAAGAYQKAHGMAAAIKNIPEILGKPMHEVRDDELADAIRKVTTAAGVPTVTSSPVVAEKIAETKPEPSPTSGAPATLDGVKAALSRYALRFDGQAADLSAAGAPVMQEDVKKILKAEIGAENLKAMPQDAATYAKLIAAVDLALANNQFKREVKI